MFTKSFWTGAAERALKTFGQTAIAFLGANVIGLIHTDWLGALDLGAGAAVLSVLTSLVTVTTVTATAPPGPQG